MMEFALAVSLIGTIVVVFGLLESLKINDKMYFVFFITAILTVYADITIIKVLMGK